MAYLLDSNTYIDAYKRYYAMDLCPGYWDWLAEAHESGDVLTLDAIKTELLRKEDEIAGWIKAAPSNFFASLDPTCQASLTTVSTWVVAQGYKQSAVTDFLSKADYFLVAYAHAHNHTVVSLEQHTSGKSKVKIPTICNALRISITTPFDLLRASSVRFVRE